MRKILGLGLLACMHALVLKVAHVKESTDNGNPMHEYNPSNIEMALICERKPLINRMEKNDTVKKI